MFWLTQSLVFEVLVGRNANEESIKIVAPGREPYPTSQMYFPIVAIQVLDLMTNEQSKAYESIIAEIRSTIRATMSCLKIILSLLLPGLKGFIAPEPLIKCFCHSKLLK